MSQLPVVVVITSFRGFCVLFVFLHRERREEQSGALSLVGIVEAWLSLVESFRDLKYFHSVATPVLLCHKEPARRIQSPLLGSRVLHSGEARGDNAVLILCWISGYFVIGNIGDNHHLSLPTSLSDQNQIQVVMR